MEGTRYSVPRVCWAEPELRCPWPGPGQGSRRLVGHQLHWSHTVATSSWPERVSIRGHQGAPGGSRGLRGTFNPLVMTRLFSQHVTG